MSTTYHCGSLLLALAPLVTAQQMFAELGSRHLPESVSDVRAMASIDIDGDGDLDLLLGRFLQPSAIWRNDGFGTFTGTGPIGSLVSSLPTSAIAVGDVDGDGDDDVVWGSLGSGLRLLFGGNNTLLEAPSSFLPPSPSWIACLSLFDVDGDQDLDLVVGVSGGFGASDHLWLNNGSGSFTDATGQWFGSVGSLPYGTNGYEPFDCDGDGDLDLLLVSWNSAPRLLRNQGGTFALGALPSTVGSATSAAAGDVDADGDLDLIIGRSSSSPSNRQDRLLRNDGTGSFVDDTVSAMPMLDNWTSSLHLSDVDGDGDLDVLVSHEQVMLFGNRLGHSLLQNGGAGVFTDVSDTLPANDLSAPFAVLADVNGDGDDDYLFSGFGPSNGQGQHLYWNDDGEFVHANATAVPVRSSTTEGVAAGDLDGDGLPELVAAGWNFSILRGRNSLYWNDGTGRMVEQASNPAWPVGFYSCAALGDVDGDGDLDLVFGTDQPGQNRLYRNDGNRVLTDVTGTALPTVNDFTRVVRLFDSDGDGDLDILCGNTGQSRLLENDGQGSFTEIAAALPASGGTRDLAVGDVDGDGDLDVVRASSSGANELWRNNGGVFQLVATGLPGIVQSTEAVALVDLDGDGDLDLLVGNRADAVLDPRSWLYYNNGTGSFLGTPVPLGSSDVRAIAAGDIEGDGDVDFLLAGHGVALRLFENLGAGSFLSQPGAMPAGSRDTNRLVLADLDGDGDLDLFEGDGGQDRVLTCLHRQLHGEQLLVSGGSTAFVAHASGGPPGAVPFAALVLGFPSTTVATPFGPARVALGTFVPVAVLLLPPAQPRAEWLLPVPASAALLGLEIGAQALIAHDLQPSLWRLSGLVAEIVRR